MLCLKTIPALLLATCPLGALASHVSFLSLVRSPVTVQLLLRGWP